MGYVAIRRAVVCVVTHIHTIDSCGGAVGVGEGSCPVWELTIPSMTAHCELTPSGPFAIATHGSVFDHAVALGQCIPNDFRFSWLVRRCLPWLETPIMHKMRVSFYSGFDTCFAPSTRNVGCWDANHISNHAFGKWERCYHLWFTDHEHYCVCVCV